jgi:hypothetical protein
MNKKIHTKGKNTRYKVVEYFDTYPCSTAGVYQTEQEAKIKADELNEQIKHKPNTVYLVREVEG